MTIFIHRPFCVGYSSSFQFGTWVIQYHCPSCGAYGERDREREREREEFSHFEDHDFFFLISKQKFIKESVRLP
jgi:hypothetical protein